jgi:hypothetical protein
MPGALPRARQSAIALLQKRDADGCALWYRTAPDEIEIHDYLEINASRAEIQAKSREQARRAKARWDSAASGAQPDSTVPEAMPAATPAARSRRESRVISPDAAGNAGSHASPSPLVPIDLKRSPPLVTARSAPAHARGTNGDALAQDEALTPELAARYAEAQQKLADARAARRQEGETNDLDPPRKRGPKLVPPGAGGADG